MDSELNCICSLMEEINGFLSLSEFNRYLTYLGELIDCGELTETPVVKRYAGFEEQWYKCTKCDQVWKLVYPDYPFTGIWNTVGG